MYLTDDTGYPVPRCFIRRPFAKTAAGPSGSNQRTIPLDW